MAMLLADRRIVQLCRPSPHSHIASNTMGCSSDIFKLSIGERKVLGPTHASILEVGHTPFLSVLVLSIVVISLEMPTLGTGLLV